MKTKPFAPICKQTHLSNNNRKEKDEQKSFIRDLDCSFIVGVRRCPR